MGYDAPPPPRVPDQPPPPKQKRQTTNTNHKNHSNHLKITVQTGGSPRPFVTIPPHLNPLPCAGEEIGVGCVERIRHLPERYNLLVLMSFPNKKRPPRLLRFRREPLGLLSSGGGGGGGNFVNTLTQLLIFDTQVKRDNSRFDVYQRG